MIEAKNRLMLFISLAVTVISFIVLLIHQNFTFETQAIPMDHIVLVKWFGVAIPAVLIIVAFIIYNIDARHKAIAILNLLILTFASNATIVAGDGMVVYHFSIFLVVAAIAYYERISYIMAMSVIFAVMHFVAYFIPIVGNVYFDNPDYPFFMLMIHILFVVFTAGATSWQILDRNKLTRRLRAENEGKQEILDNVIVKLNDTSQNILETVSDLRQGTDASEESGRQISASIGQMAASTERQLHHSQTNAEMLEEMTANIQQIAARMESVNNESNATIEASNSGQKTVQETIQQMDIINQSVRELEDVVNSLAERSHKIDDVITVIKDIADQTNLLALNASIEAARAGEYGKGFAIVADEVGQLATQSEQSASSVSDLIKDIQNDTTNTIKSLKNGAKEVEKGIGLIHQTEEVLNNVLNRTEQVDGHVRETTTVSNGLLENSNHVENFINEMIDSAHMTSTHSDEITGAAEREVAAMSQISAITKSLEDLAKGLEELVDQIN